MRATRTSATAPLPMGGRFWIILLIISQLAPHRRPAFIRASTNRTVLQKTRRLQNIIGPTHARSPFTPIADKGNPRSRCMSVTVDRQPMSAEQLGLQTLGQLIAHLQKDNRLVV